MRMTIAQKKWRMTIAQKNKMGHNYIHARVYILYLNCVRNKIEEK